MSERRRSEGPRYWKVWATAQGYAVVRGETKVEALRNAREGNFERTPRPDWSAQTKVEEIE